jgi:hypothetical protein
MTKIGGFKTALFALFTVLGGVFYNMFLTDIAKLIKRKLGGNQDLNTVKRIIKERISFFGIYNLHDQVDEIQEMTQA